MTIPAGKSVVDGMMQGMMPPGMSDGDKEKLLDDEDNQQEIAMDYAAMGMDMPLIKVADMSGETFTEEAVNGIVELLNQL